MAKLRVRAATQALIQLPVRAAMQALIQLPVRAAMQVLIQLPVRIPTAAPTEMQAQPQGTTQLIHTDRTDTATTRTDSLHMAHISMAAPVHHLLPRLKSRLKRNTHLPRLSLLSVS